MFAEDCSISEWFDTMEARPEVIARRHRRLINSRLMDLGYELRQINNFWLYWEYVEHNEYGKSDFVSASCFHDYNLIQECFRDILANIVKIK